MLKVSFAQNFEDIILSRVFNKPQGFYIDVGAAHPDVDSVTKYFYNQGWSGLNIEPNGDYFELLQRRRSRDTNLNCAVADSEGEAVFTFVKNDPKLSSIEELSPDLIAKEKLEIVKKLTPLTTLKKVIEERKISKVDFLKIDAEGAEAKVLAGFPFAQIKPRLVLIESVEAKSTVSTKGAWEHQLTEQGYISVYSDGINDYYVQKNDKEAIDLLRVPLNSTDNFIKYEHTRLKFLVRTLRKKLFQ